MTQTPTETLVKGDYKEEPVDGWEGWTRVSNGTNRRFRSPGGLEVSNKRFYDLRKQYQEQGYIPESEVLPPAEDTSKPKAKFFSSDQVTGEEEQKHPPSVKEIVTSVKPNDKTTSTRRGLRNSLRPAPTATALAIGFKMLFLLLTTGVIVRLLQDERAAMTEAEATVLGNALGNLLAPTDWNIKYGWLVAETGDWQAIGYVAITYAGRVGDIAMDKRNMKQQQQQYPQQQHQQPMTPRQHQAPEQPSTAQDTYAPAQSNGNGHTFMRINNAATPITRPGV